MLRGVFILLFIAHTTLAQFNFRIDQSIPVYREDGEPLAMPWAGGLNSVQVNTMDINGDEFADLVVYDRTAERVITFVRNNSVYEYAPQFETLFPAELDNWMLLRDYNGDGLKDIFTNNNGDIWVFMNVTPEDGPLQWEHVFFFDGISSMEPHLMTKGTIGKTNVHTNSNDIPAINDADGDGDLDVFVTRFNSGATIEFHKNFSKERFGSLDSLELESISNTWGGLTECDCGEFAFDGDPCNAGGRTKHVGGKNLLVFDADNDGDHDMLFAEEGHASEGGCSQLYLLENQGNNLNPIVTEAVAYPTSFPVNMRSYPAASFEDVDFDGKKDLLVSPNLAAQTYFVGQTYAADFNNSVWLYKNSGTTEAPVFTTPNTNFLQEAMIDVGDNATPAFFDIDGDADMDMFIGYNTQDIGNSIFRGSIQYFENIGTPKNPSFKKITEDYLNLSLFNFRNVKPAFADMNSDGKIDLAFTASSLTDGLTRLFYLPNRNFIGGNFDLPAIGTNFSFQSAGNVSIIDVDFDGRKDLLFGTTNGSSGWIEYWRNYGVTEPEYVLVDPLYLSAGTTFRKRNPSCAADDLNGDGKTDLIISHQNGTLEVISDFRNATDTTTRITHIIYNPVQNNYGTQNLGGPGRITTANLFGTNIPVVVVGNILGGLYILRAEETESEKTPTIDIYPNPVAIEKSTLTLKVDRPAAVIAFNSLGKEIGSPTLLQAHETYSYRLSGFSKGIYYLRFVIDGETITRRVVVY